MKTGATGWRQQYLNEGFACLNGEFGRAESCKCKKKCDQVLVERLTNILSYNKNKYYQKN